MSKVKRSNSLEKVFSGLAREALEALDITKATESWPRFMDTQTTALYLDKSETCIRNWIREGVIPTVQLSTLQGRRRLPVFVDRHSLDRLLTAKS